MQVRIYKTPQGITQWLRVLPTQAALFEGDCLALLDRLPENCIDLAITSPPYCMGKEYEARGRDVTTFVQQHRLILPRVVRVLKPGASLCWQVGYHYEKGLCTPLDYLVLKEMEGHPDMRLRNRIAWTFGHGLHASNRFSGRHETVLWFTKGGSHAFNLDAVRIVQKYQGKRSSRGAKKGLPSGNPLGKNPSDVWDLPNVNANHVEKTGHPCQFPIALAQRLIRALTKPGDFVLDPFCGVGSAGAAALIERRHFIGAELETEYVQVAAQRLSLAARGELPFRPAERAIHVPKPTDKVARRPEGFALPIQS